MISCRHNPFLLVFLVVVLSPLSAAFTGSLLLRKFGESPVTCAGRPPSATHLSVMKANGAEAQALKQTILDEAAGTSNGLEASRQQRDAISKAVNGLVALNPTEDITTSDLATGTWNLVYTTTTGASGGKLGPFVGEVQQEVDIADGLYVNYVRIGPLTGELEATWEAVNKTQWKVIFKTIAFLLFGQQLVKKELGQVGLWTLLYLDKDMRVLTARSLERDTGNLYVLARA